MLVKKQWKESEVCRGENKTKSECFCAGLGLQKEDNRPRFPEKKKKKDQCAFTPISVLKEWVVLFRVNKQKKYFSLPLWGMIAG